MDPPLHHTSQFPTRFQIIIKYKNNKAIKNTLNCGRSIRNVSFVQSCKDPLSTILFTQKTPVNKRIPSICVVHTKMTEIFTHFLFTFVLRSNKGTESYVDQIFQSFVSLFLRQGRDQIFSARLFWFFFFDMYVILFSMAGKCPAWLWYALHVFTVMYSYS